MHTCRQQYSPPGRSARRPIVTGRSSGFVAFRVPSPGDCIPHHKYNRRHKERGRAAQVRLAAAHATHATAAPKDGSRGRPRSEPLQWGTQQLGSCCRPAGVEDRHLSRQHRSARNAHYAPLRCRRAPTATSPRCQHHQSRSSSSSSASHPQAPGSAVMPHHKAHATATIRLRSCMSAAQTRAGAGACRHTTPPPCGYR
ncbi:hypothetical protein DQ04_08761030 [Trypanosoma grayi]|uniref:hypothetical protein n=1 Tax=Trypanosoma grayi TaxID=71804 RepID=UPI0004F45B13|nr:hypothetical protein DQ04_08761030 [Trypanosoma grayi]KEG07813.1 hypothetical protein DQ04_08761030 [Trypanosoma grayi]